MHTVKLNGSDITFNVGDDQAILEAALLAGVTLPYSCRGGTCGTCAAKIIAGEVSYPPGQPIGLSAAAQTEKRALLCQARACSDLTLQARQITGAQDIPIQMMPVRVEKLERLAHDVMRLYLRSPASRRLQFLAGQYIDIILQDGRRRSFSLANAPHDDELLELHIRHVPGGFFTTHVFDQMKEKALIRIEGPLGTFFLREDSERPIILMGGGTGFAPLKGIVEHAIQIGVKRPIHLFWGVRAARDLYLHDLALSWSQRHNNVQYTPVLSHPEPNDNWTGLSGWVHEAVVAEYPSLSQHEVYMSGPPPMIQAAQAKFSAAGLDPDHLFFDSFEFAHDNQ